MIVNLRPESLGLLDCVVEECDERFTAEQQDEIIAIIRDTLGADEREADGEGANGVNGEVANGTGTSGSIRERDQEGETEEDGP